MSSLSARTLYWIPRALSIAFLTLLSLFALDVFNEHLGFWKTAIALSIHLIPVFVLAGVLVGAWRWEWIGGVLYAVAGTLYIYQILPRHLPPAIKLNWILTIAGPAFIIAGLFLANWLKRDELRKVSRGRDH
jgi:hypothetical protein